MLEQAKQNFDMIEKSNYEIIKKIGRGKYSEVYEGINTLTNQRIVIKILKPGKFLNTWPLKHLNTSLTQTLTLITPLLLQ